MSHKAIFSKFYGDQKDMGQAVWLSVNLDILRAKEGGGCLADYLVFAYQAQVMNSERREAGEIQELTALLQWA